MSTPDYDPLPDIAAVIAGLMVPRSIGGGSVLGTALEPYDRLRQGLGLFGWDASDIEPALRQRLRPVPAPQPEPETCPQCRQPRIGGIIAHKMDCTGMWGGTG